MEYASLIMFVAVCGVLMMGYPVALSLAGTALAFAGLGMMTGTFDSTFLNALPARLYGTMTNQTLMAVPLFVFMGIMLEKSKIAENLLDAMSLIFGRFHAGLGISVILVGALLAASTGIVGATVVTMGLMSLPTMLKRGYNKQYATGVIAATGTLGQIIPPSIALVLLGDVLSTAYQQAQLKMGNFAPDAVSVGDLFAGAMIPGLLLVCLYILYTIVMGLLKPDEAPKVSRDDLENFAHDQSTSYILLTALVPPLLLITVVLGSILFGFATPTEASGVG
ncbi:MAG: TRAP transporter large permease subunit, partial [Algicola sp.]|nr:TRAP transporter large permease subunit [Algicola sp.]